MAKKKWRPPSPRQQQNMSDRQQRVYRERIYVGIGVVDVDEPVTEAIRLAYEHAWQQAAAGRARGPLRVLEHHVDGVNPPNWCRIVLIDDGV